MHHKSLSAFPVEEAIRKAEGQLEKILQSTDTAFQTVVLLSLELNRLLKTPAGVLPFFDKEIVSLPLETKSPRIAQAIGRCREIDAKLQRK